MTSDSLSSSPALLAERYQSGIELPDGPWSEVIATMLSHRSVRAYKPDPLPQGTLERLIAAAQSASTSSNLQAWSVVAVEEPASKEVLFEIAGSGQRHIRQAPLVLVWLADLHRLEVVAASRDIKPEALSYIEMFLVGVIDAALAAQNFSVAAESLGLGTVFVGSLRNKIDVVADLLKLPPQVMPVFGLCVGYPDPSRPGTIRPRLEQGAILHHETYNSATQLPTIQRYDDVMSRWYASQRINAPDGWIGQTAQRIENAAALSGRDIMRELLLEMGFGLR
ncbi:MAG: NADPH-dependent oxidoreductase [Georgfuchsia sp.]